MKSRKTAAQWLKLVSRLIMTAGVITALVFAAMGVANMLSTRAADEAAQTEKKVIAAQNAEAKKLMAAAEAEAKAAAEAAAAEAAAQGIEYVPTEYVPEEIDPTTIEVNIAPVRLTLDEYIGPLFTGYLVWSIVSLVAAVALSSFVAGLKDRFDAMRRVGTRRVTAEALFCTGALAAIVVLCCGCWHVLHLDIKKPTLVDVWAVLRVQYLPWSVAALGCGIGLRFIILHLGEITDRTFQSVGVKLMIISRRLFQIALGLLPFAVAGSVAAALLAGWIPGLICLAAVGVTMLICWLLSLALNALGTCTMIMEPQAQAAFEKQEALLNATEWICPSCGQVHPIHVGTCPECGTVRQRPAELLG